MYPKNDPKKFPDVPGDRTPDLVNRHQIVYPLSDPERDGNNNNNNNNNINP
jgi:hypothetical protein